MLEETPVDEVSVTSRRQTGLRAAQPLAWTLNPDASRIAMLG
jgi:hypothetical protein